MKKPSNKSRAVQTHATLVDLEKCVSYTMRYSEYVVESVSVQSRISLPRFLRKRRTWGVLNGSFRVHAKVIKDIDLMIKNLRDEEKADIEHRDW